MPAPMGTEPAPPVVPTLWRRVPRGRVLAFAPHPDDEAAGPGGVLALHRAQGDPVRVVVATDGTSGDPDGRIARDALPAVRRAESRAGCAALGVDDVVFWGFPDGHVLSPTDLDTATRLVLEALASFAPDVVYLPWARDGHPDHHALHEVVTRALDRAAFAGLALGYEIWNAMIPDVVVETTPVFERKRAAMRAHASQLAYTQYDHALVGLAAYRSLQHLHGRGYAEAFQLVRGALPAALAEPR
jgi:LmbE family N-acetylglucosaminyl deacetylase